MSNWKKYKVYCRGCGEWQHDLQHRSCPKGAQGSVVFIDLDDFKLGCNKCNDTWALEDNTHYCNRGHVQETVYQDSAVALQQGDQIIASDGDWVYVLTRSGTVVVGRRSYPGSGYS